MKYLISPFFLLLFACDYDETPATVETAVPSIKASSVTLEADGESRVTLSLDFDGNTPRAKTATEFRTTAGIFDENDKDIASVFGEIDASQKRVAQVTLISPLKTGQADIIAKVVGYVKTTTISLIPAKADDMTLVPDKVSIKSAPDSEIKFTVNLFRKKGKPSLEREVKFKVTDGTNNEIGILREYRNKSDADGRCYFTFTLGTNPYTGPLKAEAKYDEGAITKTFDFISIKP